MNRWAPDTNAHQPRRPPPATTAVTKPPRPHRALPNYR